MEGNAMAKGMDRTGERRRRLQASGADPQIFNASLSCAKSTRLLDLPEKIAEPLIGICLDGMRLGAGKLLVSVDKLEEHPTTY